MTNPAHAQAAADVDTRLDVVLLRAVDAGLAVSVFAVPLVLGGRLASGQLVLVAAVLIAAAVWCARQALRARAGWIRSGAEPILVGALVWVGLSLFPLHPAVLEILSGGVYERLPLWAPASNGAATLGTWSTLSLNPAATQAGLIVLASFVMLFLVAVQRIRRIDDVERLLRWIAWATVGVAALGLLQYGFGCGKYFGFYHHRGASIDSHIVGSFTNRNHFAHFMALGIGPLLWWVAAGLRGREASRQCYASFGRPKSSGEVHVVIRAIGLGLAVFAGVASLSRGGTLAILVALTAGFGVLYAAAMIRRNTLIALAASGAAVAGGLLAYGYESVAQRMGSFESLTSLDPLGLRRDLWAADLRAVADFPIAGTGLGTHVDVFPLYLPNTWSSQKVDFTHAESGYIQLPLETGIPGLLLALAAAGLVGYWCASTIRREAGSPRAVLCFAAIVPALGASLVHSLVDFVWYVPGLMVVVVLLAACACRLWQGAAAGEPAEPPSRAVPRAAWVTAAACLLVVGSLMAKNRFSAAAAEISWQRYQLLSETLPDCDADTRRATLQRIAEHLDRVVRWDPNHARAHAELAGVHRELFSVPSDGEVCSFDVRQVREAVLASRFESSEAMVDWLRRAFGSRCRHLWASWRHARTAVSMCPLLGQAYLCLADVSFLEGPAALPKSAYVDQAVRTRPMDGTVLFAAGQEAMLAGRTDRALQHWKASFRCGRLHQQRLLRALSDQIPADKLLRMLEPDREAMSTVRHHYGQRQRPEEMGVMWRYYAESARQHAQTLEGSAAAAEWLIAANAYKQVGQTAERLQCLQLAVRFDPANYEAHRGLALALLASEQFEAAEEQLTWCLRQKPDDRPLRAELERLLERQHWIGQCPQELR